MTLPSNLQEHHTRFLSKAMGGAYPACYFLAVSIFVLSGIRDVFFEWAMGSQPDLLTDGNRAVFEAVGTVVMGVGLVFVLATYYKLGITGTYLGDYCGILMDAKVTSFPFDVLSHPMYTGATAIFLGQAIRRGSPAGLLLTGVVALVYAVAESYEGPFTSMIYATRNRKSKSS